MSENKLLFIFYLIFSGPITGSPTFILILYFQGPSPVQSNLYYYFIYSFQGPSAAVQSSFFFYFIFSGPVTGSPILWATFSMSTRETGSAGWCWLLTCIGGSPFSWDYSVFWNVRNAFSSQNCFWFKILSNPEKIYHISEPEKNRIR